MRTIQILSYVVIVTASYILGGCNLIDAINPNPKIIVTGRVVAFRDNKPLEGVSVKTYKELFNCGSICSTFEIRDSSITDANGFFSFKASATDLNLSIFKKGYFGLFPGDGSINQRTQAGGTDYRVISLKPSARIIITYFNKISDQDSLYYEYYACGDRVNTGMGSPFRSGKEITLEWGVEGNCTLDIFLTVYRKGTKTILKESIYVPQAATVYKTIQY